MALPDTAAAEADGLELRIAAHDARLRVALANRSQTAVSVYFAALGPTALHHDHLRAELTGSGGTRTLRFTGRRNASRIGLEALDPGEEVADDIDLAAWATDRINGAAPLDPGEYALSATYEVARPDAWSGAITAGPIRLVVP
jgi:hypothetical protein